MNIRLYTSGPDFSNRHSLNHEPGKKAAAPASETGSFDKATFTASAPPSDDLSFARVLAQSAAKSLETPVSPGRVEEIRRQTASGTYQPDARKIAERMLGYR